jgi:glycosyltransferase involved in cell wall biosynthesis
MIAVLLTKYEGEDRLLDKCLESLTQQTNQDFKLYETDEASFSSKLEEIFTDGFKYVCYLDSYDYYLPNHIETIQKAIPLTKTKYIYTISKVVRYKDCGGACCIEDEVPRITDKLYDERSFNKDSVIRSSICINYNNDTTDNATQINIITVTHRLSE